MACVPSLLPVKPPINKDPVVYGVMVVVSACSDVLYGPTELYYLVLSYRPHETFEGLTSTIKIYPKAAVVSNDVLGAKFLKLVPSK